MKNFTYDDELYHYGVKGMKWRHHKKTDPTKAGRTGPKTSDDEEEDSFSDLIPDSYKEELKNLMRTVAENTPTIREINELYKIYKNLTKEHPEYTVSNMERSFRNQGVGVANLPGYSRRNRTTKRRRKKK